MGLCWKHKNIRTHDAATTNATRILSCVPRLLRFFIFVLRDEGGLWTAPYSLARDMSFGDGRLLSANNAFLLISNALLPPTFLEAWLRRRSPYEPQVRTWVLCHGMRDCSTPLDGLYPIPRPASAKQQ